MFKRSLVSMTSAIQRQFITAFIVVILAGFVFTGLASATIYSRVAIVAASGGDYTDPLTAMNNSSAWCPSPSATNPCLLKIMPGVYDVGSTAIQMTPYIDMEGSGENVTKIKGAGSTSTCGSSNNGCLIYGNGGNELRFLTIENYGPGNGYVTGVSNINKLKSVTVNMLYSGPCEGYYTYTGVWYGAYGLTLPLELDNVKITTDMGTCWHNVATGVRIFADNTAPVDLSNVSVDLKGSCNGGGAGVWLQQGNLLTIRNSRINAASAGCIGVIGVKAEAGSSSTIITDSTVSGTYDGVYGNASVTIDHSSVYGVTNSIRTWGTVKAAYSKIYGGPMTGAGTIKCIGAYNNNYDPITCP